MLDKTTIFLSYFWNDTEIANKIDSYFENDNVVIDRGIRAIENWKSIKDIMNTIRKHNCVIMIISDSYLHSINCLYEMIQLIKDLNFAEKVFPLISGVRVGEIAALMWDDIQNGMIVVNKSEKYNREKKEYWIGPTKNGKERYMPLTDEIINLLMRIKAVQQKYGFSS